MEEKGKKKHSLYSNSPLSLFPIIFHKRDFSNAFAKLMFLWKEKGTFFLLVKVFFFLNLSDFIPWEELQGNKERSNYGLFQFICT